MAIIEIPVRSDILAYTINVILDGNEYVLRFTYSRRPERWIMDILDTQETVLKGGIPLLTNVDLIGIYGSTDLPQGKFVCVDITGNNKTAEENDLGVNVKLLYEEAND
jgi:hypothetical protein